MTLTIDLPPEVESRVRALSADQGCQPAELIARVVTDSLAAIPASGCLSKKESELLQQINRGFDEATWTRYRELIALRDTEAISEPERQELIGLSDQLEELNAERIGHLSELAKIRNVPVRELMDQLGIHPVAIES